MNPPSQSWFALGACLVALSGCEIPSQGTGSSIRRKGGLTQIEADVSRPSPVPSAAPTSTPLPSPSPSPPPSPSPSPVQFIKGNPCGSNGRTVYFGNPSPSGDGICSITTPDGLARSYRLHVPANYVPGAGSIVINLHGHSTIQDALNQEYGSGMTDHSDLHGYAVAYPDSTINAKGSHAWNISDDPTRANDDVFLRLLATQLVPALRADPKRVYVTGMSGGGLYTYILATRLSDVFAAAAPISGKMIVPAGDADLRNYPAPVNPIPILMVNGDADSAVTFCGGPFTNSSGQQTMLPSVEDDFDHWVRVNGCRTVSSAAPFCVGLTPNTAVIDHKTATGCALGADVEQVALRGGVHTWYPNPMNDSPSASMAAYNSTFPKAGSTGVSENDLIWAFFKAHPKP